MSAAQSALAAALQATIGREIAHVESSLKAWPDLDAVQIDAAASAPIDSNADSAADELSLDSQDASRDGTPDGSSGTSATPSGLTRHSNCAVMAICGHWGSAPNALSSNLGRLLNRVNCFNGAVADLRQPQAAVQQRQQLGLWRWLHDSLLPLLRGFADGSLLLSDEDLPAVCNLAQRLVNAQLALLAQDPPAAQRSFGEQAVQILAYVFTSEYLRREGVRLPSGDSIRPEAQFARTANKQVFACYVAVRSLSHASQMPFQLDALDAAQATQGELVRRAQEVQQPLVEAMARELLQAAEEYGLVVPFSLFHSQYIKPLFERRRQGGSLITCSFGSRLCVLFEGILNQLAAFEIHAAAAGVEFGGPTLSRTVKEMRQQLTAGDSSARQLAANLQPRPGRHFGDRAVKTPLDQDAGNCTSILVPCWSAIGGSYWWSGWLLTFFRTISGPSTDQKQAGRSDKDASALRQAPPDLDMVFVPQSQEAPEVEPVEPPAKRPRLFSRADTALFEQLLRQDMLRGMLGWLQGGSLATKAVQGLPQIAHPFLNTCKLPVVDPALVHSGVPERLLDLCRPADHAEDVLLADDGAGVLEDNFDVLDAELEEAQSGDLIDSATINLLFRLAPLIRDRHHLSILDLKFPELRGFTPKRMMLWGSRLKPYASANDFLSNSVTGKYWLPEDDSCLLEHMIAKGKGFRGYEFGEMVDEAGATLGGRNKVQLKARYQCLASMYNEIDPAALLELLQADGRYRRQGGSMWTDAQDAALIAGMADANSTGEVDWDAVAALPGLGHRTASACRGRWVVVNQRNPDAAAAALPIHKRSWTSEETSAVRAAGNGEADVATLAFWEKACLQCPILRARGPKPCQAKSVQLRREEAASEAIGPWTAAEDAALNAGLEGCESWSGLLPLLQKDKRLAARGRACCQARWAELHPGRKMRRMQTTWTEELKEILKTARHSQPHASWGSIAPTQRWTALA